MPIFKKELGYVPDRRKEIFDLIKRQFQTGEDNLKIIEITKEKKNHLHFTVAGWEFRIVSIYKGDYLIQFTTDRVISWNPFEESRYHRVHECTFFVNSVSPELNNCEFLNNPTHKFQHKYIGSQYDKLFFEKVKPYLAME